MIPKGYILIITAAASFQKDLPGFLELFLLILLRQSTTTPKKGGLNCDPKRVFDKTLFTAETLRSQRNDFLKKISSFAFSAS